jgi:hypothetical protein
MIRCCELSGVLYGEALLPCALTLRSEWVFQHRDRVGDLSPNADAFYASLRWDLHLRPGARRILPHIDDHRDPYTGVVKIQRREIGCVVRRHDDGS